MYTIKLLECLYTVSESSINHVWDHSCKLKKDFKNEYMCVEANIFV